MAPKVNKSVRLQALAAFVREPHKLEELRARDGNNLQEKFLYNNVLDSRNNRALLEELDAEVTEQ